MHAELRWAQDLALNVDADARETPGRLDDVGRLSHEVLSLTFRGMKRLTRCGHGSFGFDRRVFFLSINTFVRNTCNTHIAGWHSTPRSGLFFQTLGLLQPDINWANHPFRPLLKLMCLCILWLRAQGYSRAVIQDAKSSSLAK